MPNRSLLKTLDFTKAVGNLTAKDNKKFNDASDIGGFPLEQKITGIERIELFSEGTTDTDVIVGLTVTYTLSEGGTEDVSHGIVENVTSVGTVNLNVNKSIVGASGQLKKLVADPDKNERISFIYFYVFNKDTGMADTHGPFGNIKNAGDSWGSYGPIIAFQGTTTPDLGLTTLGFTELTQGIAGSGVI